MSALLEDAIGIDGTFEQGVESPMETAVEGGFEQAIESLTEASVAAEPVEVPAYIDMLQRPATSFDPSAFRKTLAEERPALYEQLAGEMMRDLPTRLEAALSDLGKYDEAGREAIESAIDSFVERKLEQLIGQKLDTGAIAQIVRSHLQASVDQPFQPSYLTQQAADQVANQLGVYLDPTDQRHQAFWSQLQYSDWQARQQVAAANARWQQRFDEVQRQGQQVQPQPEIASNVDNQLKQVLTSSITALKINNAKLARNVRAALESKIQQDKTLAELRSDIVGWCEEGLPSRAEPLVDQYRRTVERLAREAAGPRPKAAAPRPQQQTARQRARTDEEYFEQLAEEALADLHARGAIR